MSENNSNLIARRSENEESDTESCGIMMSKNDSKMITQRPHDEKSDVEDCGIVMKGE